MTDLLGRDVHFSFSAPLWIWPGPASWHFITLPTETADEIKFFTSTAMTGKRRGFGSVPVHVTISEVSWKTSIFPDKRSGSFVLPIKAEIRKQLTWQAGDERSLHLRVRGT